MWLLRVPPDAGADEVRTRVLLAIEATDRATFDMVVSVCLAHLELSRLRTDIHREALSAEAARAELTDATLAAEVGWLQSLRTRQRQRDRVEARD
jgi:hypothetical protein